MPRFPEEAWSGPLRLETDASEEERLVAGGSVAETVRKLLAAGQVHDAARALRMVAGASSVGDQLVEEIAAAPPLHRANVLRMFVEARDYARAARCCERMDDHGHAGELYERGGQLDRAADAFLAAGLVERAATVLERSQDFARAAELYLKARLFLKAAQSFERAGRFHAAGELYARLAKWSKAAEVLQRVTAQEPDYLKATLLLGRLLSAARQPVMAAQCYRLALQTYGLRQDSLEIQYRLAVLLRDSDRVEEAVRLLRDLADVSPGYKDVEEQLRALTGESASDGAAPAASASAEGASDAEVTGLDLVSLDADVEFLRKVPLFAELAVTELHDLLQHWECVTYTPASVVVREGDDERRLVIVKEGRARVVADAGETDEHVLRTSGPASGGASSH
ncbi:MAG: hypothetical protein IPK07_20280 [Deltaproteobacteria bacterium]|nr:hypothetical protein [Deltaproteobacteria bacterium]